MKCTPINPTDWAKSFLEHGDVVEGATRILTLSGQVSVIEDADAAFGVVAKHPNDMRAQMQDVFAGIDTILEQAGMTRRDLIHMRFFVTDMKAGLGNADVMMEWLGDLRPPQSFIGFSELFLPGLVIEIEVTAATSS